MTSLGDREAGSKNSKIKGTEIYWAIYDWNSWISFIKNDFL